MKNEKELFEKYLDSWSTDSIRLLVTPSNVAKSTYFYVQEIGYFKTVAPYFTERENLDSYLIVYTISGRGFLEYIAEKDESDTFDKKETNSKDIIKNKTGNGYRNNKNNKNRECSCNQYENRSKYKAENKTEITEIRAGQVFYIDCHNYHKYWTAENEEWEFLWVHFNGNNAKGYYTEFENNGFRVIDSVENSIISETIRQMIDINKKKNITTEIQTSNKINNILTELLIQNCIGNSIGNGIDGDGFFVPEDIKKIAKQIDRNFTKALSLSHLAKAHNRSKYHLAKEFKRYIGVTLNEYIILARLSYAKELLKYSEMPISEITYEIGMNNVTHFINLFKDREHMTPLVYRREWRR